MGDLANIKYIGATPGADPNTYTLFNTVTSQMGQRALGIHGIRKLFLSLKGNNAGTLKWYTSSDRGLNWVQLGQEAVAALAASASIQRDYPVEAEPDFKLDWVNGGAAQNPWIINMALDSQRAMF